MAIAYSQDLRIGALKLIENGMSISKVSKLLQISRPTLQVMDFPDENNRFNSSAK